MGSTLDSTERIVRYLSNAGIGINVVTIQHFQTVGGQELLAQVFLIEPTEVASKARAASKRRPPLTFEQLRTIAEGKGLGAIYASLVDGLSRVFDQRSTTVSSIAFRGKVDGGYKVILSLIPSASDPERGLHFQIYAHRIAAYLGLSQEQVISLLPPDREPWAYWGGLNEQEANDWSGYAGFFENEEEVAVFLQGLIKR